MSANSDRIRDSLKKGILLTGEDLDKVVVSNMDLPELGQDVQVTEFGQVKTVRRPNFFRFNQAELADYLRKNKRL